MKRERTKREEKKRNTREEGGDVTRMLTERRRTGKIVEEGKTKLEFTHLSSPLS